MNSKILELMSQLFEISMRINLETEMACFFHIHGHVSKMEVHVAKAKEDYYHYNITNHSCYYKGWAIEDDDDERKLIADLEYAISDLNSVLSRTYTKK